MNSDRALLLAAGGGIGDTLLSTVVARALRTRYATVDALVLPAHQELVERVPDIDSIFTLEGDAFALAARLAHERFAACIVTWATLRTAVIPLLARIPKRVGQARRMYSPFFTQRVTVRSELGDARTHWTQILLDYARAIGCETADARPALVPTAADEFAATALLRVHDLDGPFALLHPTRGLSAHHTCWPLEGFVALARSIEARGGPVLFISGSKDDAPIAHAIARSAGGRTISIGGATTIGVYAALARRAQFVIAMDSGPMHVAAAVGAPTVGIFALQSDQPDRWAPLGTRTAIVRATYPCPPEHRKETCRDFPCVRQLPISAIHLAVDALTSN